MRFQAAEEREREREPEEREFITRLALECHRNDISDMEQKESTRSSSYNFDHALYKAKVTENTNNSYLLFAKNKYLVHSASANNS